ncbi:dTDP-4-dehydrorhamnose 3,5-epimerase family protein [Sodalinema gerasimenkoae]|uniref:dTDP-4-dehydrorhamnose 3,5-epimerase family protein n=1 Tax=Sodalinema gerasimenkoae TaxID=2862348 RepID=UPI0013569D85|nr:dTDP-4-dehydrorhamnose 3,5-epimerase family protein [Sodalinema gerasimenkoae]
MKLESTPIEELFVLHRPVRRDERGFFSRLFGADEIAAAGRPTEAVHVNSSTSVTVGTLRGIHFQYPPHAEAKIVSCAAGAIWDVGIDLRPSSPTRFQWFGIKLTPMNGVSMIIPEGFGHAFITLEPNSTVIYVVSAAYAPSHESGARFDDPVLGIKWPIKPRVLSEKDLAWGSLTDRIDELDTRFA